jgi:O-acetyl-ADP-ribose deacetylase (regulator of RNase III)
MVSMMKKRRTAARKRESDGATNTAICQGSIGGYGVYWDDSQKVFRDSQAPNEKCCFRRAWLDAGCSGET